MITLSTPRACFYMEQKAWLHGLAHCGSITPAKLGQLIKYFDNNAELVWKSFRDWPRGLLTLPAYKKAGVIIENFAIESEWEKLQDGEIKTVSLLEPDYPYYLKQIADPPLLLYYLGCLPGRAQKLITVVGSRKMSRYGKEAIDYLLSPLTQVGIGVVSGLAYGVDAEAHRNALTNNSYTLAVLASGVDLITPPIHDRLAQSLINVGGAIISEFAPGTPAARYHFQQRNRILAGLSPTTLIIEAAEKSGTLITSKYAVQYNRNVGVLPGSIFSQTSKGSNGLLRQGAELISKPKQLLALYNLEFEEIRGAVQLNEKESTIVDLLSTEPVSLDQLQSDCKLASSDLLTLLTTLELKGIIVRVLGQGYCRKQY